MNLKPFFSYDKILVDGKMIVKKDECLSIPSCVSEGKVVIRHLDADRYELTPNKCMEQEIVRLMQSELTNVRRRMYQTLGIREGLVLDLLLDRLQNTAIRPFTEASFLQFWHAILVDGKYEEGVDRDEDKKYILDWLLNQGLIEYDCRGYYSPKSEWVQKLKSKKTYSISALNQLMKCYDLEIISTWMISIGYERRGNSFILPESNAGPWLKL